ncbi:hypothetical protein WJ438_21730 [Streptomyces sp. GD-15H]|uniref:hypothetical protein n=1 Tax=Streptomyces sp. GD-15H TaxID=3129112 RepID=UPI0032520BC3
MHPDPTRFSPEESDVVIQAGQIKQVTHEVPGAGPAGLAFAREVAAEPHAPGQRVPEVTPTTTRRRAAGGRGHRRTRLIRT